MTNMTVRMRGMMTMISMGISAKCAVMMSTKAADVPVVAECKLWRACLFGQVRTRNREKL